MKVSIDLYDYPRVEVGWGYLPELIECLANTGCKFELVYLFENNQLVITDPSLISVLDKLNIPYNKVRPENSIQYILK